MQAGFNDPNALETLGRFNESMVVLRRCEVNASWLNESDLSPSYAHLQIMGQGEVSLLTITAGAVELPPGKGLLSG
jgi:hypothetical protein